jgi:hypothetical protein
MEHFAAALDTPFIVNAGSGAVKVVLVAANAAPPAAPGAEDARNERFSLLFRGSAGQALEQDTYWFEHSRLGRLAIFIVPTGPADSPEPYYEAVFNHAVGATDLAAQLARAP